MTIDVLPTLAALAGANLPKHAIDGKDVWPLLSGHKGAKSPHEALYFYKGRELQAVRSGKWKLHLAHDYRSLAGKPGGKGGQPVPMQQLKTPLALYDLEKDPGEQGNLADARPDIVQRLEQLADEARTELGDSRTNCKGNGVRKRSHAQEVSSPWWEDGKSKDDVFWMVWLSLAVVAELGVITVLLVIRGQRRPAWKPFWGGMLAPSSKGVCSSGMAP
jgi:arylsulfatase A-like enzyme